MSAADILDQAIALTPDREIVIKRTLDAPRRSTCSHLILRARLRAAKASVSKDGRRPRRPTSWFETLRSQRRAQPSP